MSKQYAKEVIFPSSRLIVTLVAKMPYLPIVAGFGLASNRAFGEWYFNTTQ